MVALRWLANRFRHIGKTFVIEQAVCRWCGQTIRRNDPDEYWYHLEVVNPKGAVWCDSPSGTRSAEPVRISDSI